MDSIDRLKQQRLDVERQQDVDKKHLESLQSVHSVEKAVYEIARTLIGYLDGKVTKTEVVNQIRSVETPDVEKVVKAVEDLSLVVENTKLDVTPLVAGLGKLEEQLKLIPKEKPEFEQKEEVRVTNLDEIDFTTLENAIKGIKIDTPAPVVNLPQTEVNVDAPDLDPIKKSLSDVIKAVKGIKLEVPKTDLSKVEKELTKLTKLNKEILDKPMGGGGGGGRATPYEQNGIPAFVELVGGAVPITGSITASASTLADFSTNNLDEGATSYFGQTKPDGTWLVLKVTDTSVGYATVSNNGTVTSYTDAWTNKATLTYGRFDEAF